MKKFNAKGFSGLEVLLIIIVVGLVGGVGFYVYQNKDKQTTDTSNNNNTPTSQEETQNTETPKNDSSKLYTSFSVKTSEKLKDRGSCKSGEILFAPIFNSDSFNYDCQGVKQATDYASIVFGQGTTSVLSTYSKSDLTGEDVTLSNSVKAKKYVFEASKKGEGGGDYTARYTAYEVQGKDQFFYALHLTGVGFSDEDRHLKDFNDLVLNNWEFK